MDWEKTPTGGDHRTLKAAEAVATWLNSQHGGRGRFRYRGTTLSDGRHIVERASNPDAEPRPTR